jgi:putative sterol carrier protein
MKTIEQTIETMENRITDDLASKINKLCLFTIGHDEDVENWSVDFTKPSNRISKGKQGESFACEIIVKNKEDWFSIINGELNPTTAFMHGKIKIKGNIGTALKMQTILN